MKFVLIINFTMPTIDGILKFISRTNDTVCGFEQENCLIDLNYDIYEANKFHTHELIFFITRIGTGLHQMTNAKTSFTTLGKSNA